MYWAEILRIKKFTPINEIFENLGKPMFRLGNRPVYYLGNGFLLSYSQKKFKIVNSIRVDYGDESEYALNFFYFTKSQYLETYFALKKGQYNFQNYNFEWIFTIVDEINTNWTFSQVKNYIRQKSDTTYYQVGETRFFNNGELSFQNNFIIWGDYTFLFFEKSNTTKISGFEFTLSE